MRHQTPRAASDRLANLPDVGSLPSRTRAAIDSRSVEIRLPAGSGFIRQGCPGRQTFIITEGEAEVRRDGRLIGMGSPGNIVGEVAVLRGGTRNADLVATTDVTLLVITPAELMSMCADPDFNAWVSRNIVEHAVAV